MAVRGDRDLGVAGANMGDLDRLASRAVPAQQVPGTVQVVERAARPVRRMVAALVLYRVLLGIPGYPRLAVQVQLYRLHRGPALARAGQRPQQLRRYLLQHIGRSLGDGAAEVDGRGPAIKRDVADPGGAVREGGPRGLQEPVDRRRDQVVYQPVHQVRRSRLQRHVYRVWHQVSAGRVEEIQVPQLVVEFEQVAAEQQFGRRLGDPPLAADLDQVERRRYAGRSGSRGRRDRVAAVPGQVGLHGAGDLDLRRAPRPGSGVGHRRDARSVAE